MTVRLQQFGKKITDAGGHLLAMLSEILSSPARRTYLVGLFILFIVLASGAGFLGYTLTQKNKALDNDTQWMTVNYQTIDTLGKIANLPGSMVSNQGTYLLTGNNTFYKRYEDNKRDFLHSLDALDAVTKNDAAEQEQISFIRQKFATFCKRLEHGARSYRKQLFHFQQSAANALASVRPDQEAIIKTLDEMLEQERDNLQRRIASLQQQKQDYYRILFFGLAGMAILIFLFNVVFFYTHSRRTRAELSLRETEERYALAIEGIHDGIFDWDIRRNKVFYSRQFYMMLGYDKEAETGTIEDFKSLLYPEDRDRVWKMLQEYLEGQAPLFESTFRMSHATGRHIWVRSRAGAVRARNGRPIRIVGANSDVTFLKEYESYLREGKSKAEQASRAKSDFLAHMSHEIRTPLTAISGIAAILHRKQDNFDDKQKQLIQALGTSSNTLKELICDVLDYSRIESGELEITESDFLLREIFEDIISIMEVPAREKGLAFTFDYTGLHKIVYRGDSLRLRQILLNLIGNAIKFTDQGGITVTAFRKKEDKREMLNIRVKDTGIGIPKEYHDVIFEKFKQADSSDTRRYKGSGLGLAISTSLAKMMGGTITLESEVGQGASFTLKLPMHISNEDADDLDNTEGLSKKLGDKIKTELQGTSRALIVDDYEENILVLRGLLEDLGFACDGAEDGAQCLELWGQKHYDLVLLDLQMPGIDGFDTIRAIRKKEQEKGLSRTPVIAMTAQSRHDSEEKCLQAGMDGFLQKPIVETDLKKFILEHAVKNA